LLTAIKGSGSRRAYFFEEGVHRQLKRSLPKDPGALLSGLTVGYRADFSKEFRENMARSGTTHIVALSGYNIAILVLAMSRFFGSLLKRRQTFFLTIAVILLLL